MTTDKDDRNKLPDHPLPPITPDTKDGAVPEPLKEEHERVKSAEEERQDALREGAKIAE